MELLIGFLLIPLYLASIQFCMDKLDKLKINGVYKVCLSISWMIIGLSGLIWYAVIIDGVR